MTNDRLQRIGGGQIEGKELDKGVIFDLHEYKDKYTSRIRKGQSRANDRFAYQLRDSLIELVETWVGLKTTRWFGCE
jgi:hypothetical protein